MMECCWFGNYHVVVGAKLISGRSTPWTRPAVSPGMLGNDTTRLYTGVLPDCPFFREVGRARLLARRESGETERSIH